MPKVLPAPMDRLFNAVSLRRLSRGCFTVSIRTEKVRLPAGLVTRIARAFTNKAIIMLRNKRIVKEGRCDELLFLDNELFRKFDFFTPASKVLLNEKTILVINPGEELVYRLGFEYGKNFVINNFEALQNTRIATVPEPVNLEIGEDFAVSVETMVPGTSIDISESAEEKIMGAVMPFLVDNYLSTMTRGPVEDWPSLLQPETGHRAFRELCGTIRFANTGPQPVARAVIHGDLTYRNILVDDGRYYFIDLDRSKPGFPEHDMFLLYFDYLCNKSQPITYEKLANLIVDDLLIHKKYIGIARALYDSAPLFGDNMRAVENIMKLFLLKTINNIFEDKKMKRVNIGFIDTLIKRIGG
jgi:hypothetical protein